MDHQEWLINESTNPIIKIKMDNKFINHHINQINLQKAKANRKNRCQIIINTNLKKEIQLIAVSQEKEDCYSDY